MKIKKYIKPGIKWHIALCLLGFIFSYPSFGQAPELIFENMEYDFQDVRDMDIPPAVFKP